MRVALAKLALDQVRTCAVVSSTGPCGLSQITYGWVAGGSDYENQSWRWHRRVSLEQRQWFTPGRPSDRRQSGSGDITAVGDRRSWRVTRRRLTRLNSWCMWLPGVDGQAGPSEAAVDQVWPVLDLLAHLWFVDRKDQTFASSTSSPRTRT
jgi:hypothetical protein